MVVSDALAAGLRHSGGAFVTGVIEIFAEGEGTRYRATTLHGDAETRAKYDEMGFHAGWGAALDQLVALMQTR